MKRKTWLLCALAITWMGSAAAQLKDRQPIEVTVVEGRVVVPEEVAISDASQGAIVWRMATEGYAFAPDGIVIEGQGAVFDCTVVGSQAQMFRCTKRNHEAGRRYKYDVNVLDMRRSSGPVRLPTLDPWIQNT